MLTIGSLFSGIGGFDLGLERTGGFRTAWFCEQDEFCQRVLTRHWPGVPIHSDVCALRGVSRDARPRRLHGPEVPYVDVLCGGFPCQDLSYAGAGAGLNGARSGLWSEYARLIGELRPRYVVVENVAALLARGLGTVLADLAAVGYDAEWDCIPASAVGAPHRRDRIWLVAYPSGDDGGQGRQGRSASGGAREPLAERAFQVPDAASARLEGTGLRGRSADLRAAGTDADRGRLQERREPHGGQEGPRLQAPQRDDAHRLREALAYAEGESIGTGLREDEPRGVGRGRSGDGGSSHDWWRVEPDVGRVAHGVPARVDRLRSLGNALVPQIAEWIGRRIIDYEEGRVAA